MKRVPYNTGKVQIGVHYTPPARRDMSADELRIQRMLLSRNETGYRRFWTLTYILSVLAGVVWLVYSS